MPHQPIIYYLLFRLYPHELNSLNLSLLHPYHGISLRRKSTIDIKNEGKLPQPVDPRERKETRVNAGILVPAETKGSHLQYDIVHPFLTLHALGINNPEGTIIRASREG